MSSTHEVKVVRIEAVEKHQNADSLQLIQIWGYQVVVKLGQFKVGDLASYVEPDSLCDVTREPFKFLDDGKGKQFQRITMRKFRGQPSYGLLVAAPEGSVEGDNVMELLGVGHYDPVAGGHGTGPTGFKGGMSAKGPELPAPEYNLESFKKYHRMFVEGERVILSCKIHGTSARYVFDGETFHVGSHTTWKMKPGTFIKTVEFKDEVTGEDCTKDLPSPTSAYWSAVEQHPWIEAWCRNHPGMVLYGEVYGPNVQGVNFAYGKNQGEYGFAVFDVLDHGKWVVNGEMFDNPAYSEGMLETVKVLYRGPLNVEMLKKMAEEESAYTNQKVREGIVVKLENEERRDPRLGRTALKYVSDLYYSMK